MISSIVTIRHYESWSTLISHWLPLSPPVTNHNSMFFQPALQVNHLQPFSTSKAGRRLISTNHLNDFLFRQALDIRGINVDAPWYTTYHQENTSAWWFLINNQNLWLMNMAVQASITVIISPFSVLMTRNCFWFSRFSWFGDTQSEMIDTACGKSEWLSMTTSLSTSTKHHRSAG